MTALFLRWNFGSDYCRVGICALESLSHRNFRELDSLAETRLITKDGFEVKVYSFPNIGQHLPPCITFADAAGQRRRQHRISTFTARFEDYLQLHFITSSMASIMGLQFDCPPNDFPVIRPRPMEVQHSPGIVILIPANVEGGVIIDAGLREQTFLINWAFSLFFIVVHIHGHHIAGFRHESIRNRRIGLAGYGAAGNLTDPRVGISFRVRQPISAGAMDIPADDGDGDVMVVGKLA